MQEKSDQQKGGYKPVHKETTSKLSKKITATVKIFMLNFMLNSQLELLLIIRKNLAFLWQQHRILKQNQIQIEQIGCFLAADIKELLGTCFWEDDCRQFVTPRAGLLNAPLLSHTWMVCVWCAVKMPWSKNAGGVGCLNLGATPANEISSFSSPMIPVK